MLIEKKIMFEVSKFRIYAMKKYTPIIGFFIIFLSIFGSACRKPLLNDDIRLQFSTNSITFDTVFTSLGSTTRYFTVYNPSEQDIKVDVYLAEGNTSPFSLNINGVAGNQQRDVLIPAKDSIFIYAKVTINPGNQNQPFLVCEQIIFKNS